MKTNRARTQVADSVPARRPFATVTRLALPLLLGATIGSQAARAQLPVAAPAQMPAKTYWNKHIFQLPVIIDDHVRGNLSQVLLFYKDHPAKPWTLKEKALPTQRQFSFKATQDGEYWFAVVTVDKAGRSNPADLQREPPGVIVVLDTKAPQVEMRPVPGSGGVCVRLDVRDDNAESVKTRFEFQTADKMWRSLEPIPGQGDTYCIPHQAMFTGMVRVSAMDRANNATVREMNLGSMLLGQNPPAGMVDNPVERASFPQGQFVLTPPDHQRTEPKSTGPTLDPPDQHKVASVPLPPDHRPSNTAPHQPASPPDGPIIKNQIPPAPRPVVDHTNKQYVNNTHVFLEYQIEQAGASGVGKVEIWFTMDHGQSWRRLAEDVDRKSPAEIDLPGEGLFGLSLVVTNGRGFGGTPPAPGDAPDWWIEVDASKPLAELVSVRPGVGDDANTIIINWTARDRNFGTEPIDLYYAMSREGPWVPITKGVRNDGRYRWAVPPEVGAQTFIRLVATDRAGNSTVCETSQAVALDDQSRPRARVVGVSPHTQRQTPNVPQP